ncbi:MAG: guanylate kinase [Ruminococcus sp.]|nr:guanylate kinase [Ruminococcus sp.]
MKNKGLLIVYTGASGVGKGTIMKELLRKNPNLRLSVSATTRTPREGEVDGREYYFVSHEKFDSMIAEDGFLEYAEYVGNKYGTPKEAVFRMLDEGLDVILEIEVKGFLQIKKACPECVTIFIAPPSFEELQLRLRGRGTEDEEVIAERLKTAERELQHQHLFDYVVINDDVDRAADEVLSIIANRKKEGAEL